MPGTLTMSNGTEVRFVATDADNFPAYRTIRYEFVNPEQDVEDFFIIDPLSGKVNLMKPLADFPRYQFEVNLIKAFIQNCGTAAK